jgi:hypothetical protein
MSRLSFCALDTAENHDQCIRESKFVNGYRGSKRAGSGRLELPRLQAAFHGSRPCPVPPLGALPETRPSTTDNIINTDVYTTYK